MINKETLLLIWQNAVDIIPDEDNSVFLGTLEITDAPAGVDAIMELWTNLVDTALRQPFVTSIQKLDLLCIRGFRFEEYTTLFDPGIKETEFGRYPIYQSLLITTQSERSAVIYQLSKDSYADYLEVLGRTLRVFNPFLYDVLYETDSTCAD